MKPLTIVPVLSAVLLALSTSTYASAGTVPQTFPQQAKSETSVVPGEVFVRVGEGPDASLRVMTQPQGLSISQMAKMLATASGEKVLVSTVTRSRWIESDPKLSSQWGHWAVKSQQAWTLTKGEAVTVAVIDTGVDAAHEDLTGRVLPGWDVYNPSTQGWVDDNGHGTHVSGIIGAGNDNGIGGSGVAPGVNILPVKVLDSSGYGDDADVALGVQWALDHGARVINMSLGSETSSPPLQAAIELAESRGVVVVVASGNSRVFGNPVMYPAAYPSVLAVASVGASNTSSYFSSSGDHVDVAAPGESILSTIPGGYGNKSGTSMAAPFAAGVAALVVAAHPDWSPSQVRSRLMDTAVDTESPGVDANTGHGVVDAWHALTDASYGGPDVGPAPSTSPGLNPLPLPSMPAPSLPPGITLPPMPSLPPLPGPTVSKPPGVTPAPMPSNPTPVAPQPPRLGLPAGEGGPAAKVSLEVVGSTATAHVKDAKGVAVGLEFVDLWKSTDGKTWSKDSPGVSDMSGTASWPVQGYGYLLQARVGTETVSNVVKVGAPVRVKLSVGTSVVQVVVQFPSCARLSLQRSISGKWVTLDETSCVRQASFRVPRHGNLRVVARAGRLFQTAIVPVQR